MALERRQFIGLTTQEAAQFDGLDREITVDTTNGTLRVHTEDSPHGNRLAKYSELDSVNSLMLSEFDSVRSQINEVDDTLSNSIAAETSARENADASLSSSIGVNTTAIDGLTTNVAGLGNRLATVETALPNKQDLLVSGTNIKTLNGNSLLGSGNIEIQGGGESGSNTMIHRVGCPYYVNSSIKATWYSTASETSSVSSRWSYYMDYPLQEVLEFYHSSIDLTANKFYPIVLFSLADAIGNDFATFCELYKPVDKYHLKIFSNKNNTTNTGFGLLLVKTEDAGNAGFTTGITNSEPAKQQQGYTIEYVDSLPSSPDSNTIYLIPES